MSDIQDIDAWREAHLRLTLAIAQSRDNISKELATRRYLLEEITRCKAATGTPAKKNEGAKAKKKPAAKEEPKREIPKSEAKTTAEKTAKKIPHKKTTIPPKSAIAKKQSTVVKKSPAVPVSEKSTARVNPKPNPVSSEIAQALKNLAQGIGTRGAMSSPSSANPISSATALRLKNLAKGIDVGGAKLPESDEMLLQTMIEKNSSVEQPIQDNDCK